MDVNHFNILYGRKLARSHNKLELCEVNLWFQSCQLNSMMAE